MFTQTRVELTGFSWDKATYEKLGFTTREKSNSSSVVHLVHDTAACGIISMLLELGQHGLVFHGLSEQPWFLFVANGKRALVVQAIVGRCEPAVSVTQDGGFTGLQQALEYNELIAAVKARMRNAEEDHRRG